MKLSIDAANALYTFSKAMKLTDMKKTFRPCWSMIQCEVLGGILTAQFLNEHGVTEFKCRVEDAEDGKFWLAPPERKFSEKKDIKVTIENDDKQTTYITAQGSQSFLKCEPAGIADRFKLTTQLSQEAQAGIYLNPALLASALSGYTGEDIVKFEIIDTKRGIYLKNKHGAKTLVLPISAKEEF